jgi:hypothetical protein
MIMLDTHHPLISEFVEPESVKEFVLELLSGVRDELAIDLSCLLCVLVLRRHSAIGRKAFSAPCAELTVSSDHAPPQCLLGKSTQFGADALPARRSPTVSLAALTVKD